MEHAVNVFRCPTPLISPNVVQEWPASEVATHVLKWRCESLSMGWDSVIDCILVRFQARPTSFSRDDIRLFSSTDVFGTVIWPNPVSWPVFQRPGWIFGSRNSTETANVIEKSNRNSALAVGAFWSFGNVNLKILLPFHGECDHSWKHHEVD